MPAKKMHSNEVNTDENLVSRLLTAQFPKWANLLIESVPSAGTSNALYLLGDEMVVRLPRTPGAAEQVDKEQKWLPKLAPFLPLAIPIPLAKGQPGEGYPWHWSIYNWIKGEKATLEGITDPIQAATDLVSFIKALHQIDPTGGPSPGSHNFHRGIPIATRDTEVRRAITSLEGMIDTKAVTKAWESALNAPTWDGPPVWIHGDIKFDNLLLVDGRISAVIDFGGLGVGDPACDLIVAWDLFTSEARQIFRKLMSMDDATWARGRGWALSVALVALPYYLHTNPEMVSYARRLIREVLADLDA